MFALFFKYLLKTHRNTQKFKPQSITGQYYNIYIYIFIHFVNQVTTQGPSSNKELKELLADYILLQVLARK